MPMKPLKKLSQDGKHLHVNKQASDFCIPIPPLLLPTHVARSSII